MPKLIPVAYNRKKYPPEIMPKLIEIPAHFDCKPLSDTEMEYSLHTEYSYNKRNFISDACAGFKAIRAADEGGVPKLWFNKEWVSDFLCFLVNFVGNNKPPKIIEIHPPFDDYCPTIEKFIEIYKDFEKEVLSIWPKVLILLENRSGTKYRNGNFLISNLGDLKQLIIMIEAHHLELRIALDIPQLFQAHNLDFFRGRDLQNGLLRILDELYAIRDYIESIHIWGKCIGKNNRPSSHMGTLDSYFGMIPCKEISAQFVSNSKTEALEYVADLKSIFLKELYRLFDDGKVRYFLPEVNSKNEHLFSIVKDLQDAGFEFI